MSTIRLTDAPGQTAEVEGPSKAPGVFSVFRKVTVWSKAHSKLVTVPELVLSNTQTVPPRFYLITPQWDWDPELRSPNILIALKVLKTHHCVHYEPKKEKEMKVLIPISCLQT